MKEVGGKQKAGNQRGKCWSGVSLSREREEEHIFQAEREGTEQHGLL